jgi:hypothetical protein
MTAAFRGLTQSLQEIPGQYVHYDTTVSFQIIIYLSSYHPTLYGLNTEKESLNNLRN